MNAVAINIKDLVDASVGSREHEGPQEQKWRTCINNANANITTLACYARCSIWRDWQGMKISAAVEIDNQKFRIKSRSPLLLLFFIITIHTRETDAHHLTQEMHVDFLSSNRHNTKGLCAVCLSPSWSVLQSKCYSLL